ncbi:MAG: isoprenylcysteine carboxylmethyltransferase family protein [Chthoniobacterales bacterium]
MFSLLGLSLLVSEIVLGLRRRSQTGAEKKDRGTLRMLWVIILLSIASGYLAAQLDLGPHLPGERSWIVIGVVLFVLGATLRWWSVLHLGRFFTVDVAVASDHRLIDNGPYRFVRHPSYTGLLLEFTGLAFCLGHVVSLAVILLPIFFAQRRRIEVEERALQEKLGEPYHQYCARTKRLLPFLY